MKMLSFAAAFLLIGAASAQEVRVSPLVDARLRSETVEQTDLPRTANAVTVRLRPGLAATSGAWQALVEAEATLAIIQRYNSGSNDRTRFALVVDPQNVELNRAQLRYSAAGAVATAGRQRIELADQRFVGSAPFRQNEQTYDAVRLQWGEPAGLFADLTYAWSVRTVNGINGRGSRQQAVSGDNLFALAGRKTPIGLLTAFAYVVDQDEAAVQGFRLSSQTYGVRWTGAIPLATDSGLAYVASWARQSDWHRNPNDYAADYWLAEATASKGPVSLTGGYEVLGADDGRALTSVQTPLSSLFKFQGWADKFAITPPNGIRDLYGTTALAWKKAGWLDAAGLSATWHRFRSDRLGQGYGSEWDLLATARRGRTALSLRFAHYRADQFATDTDKLWLQVDWSL